MQNPKSWGYVNFFLILFLFHIGNFWDLENPFFSQGNPSFFLFFQYPFSETCGYIEVGKELGGSYVGRCMGMEWLIVSTWLIIVVNFLAYFLGSSLFDEFCCLLMTSKSLVSFLALLSLFILVRSSKRKCLVCICAFKIRAFKMTFFLKIQCFVLLLSLFHIFRISSLILIRF